MIDGNPAEIFPAYYALRAVVVPSGPHTVEFRYDPLSFRLGLWISTVALVVFGAGATVHLKRIVTSGSVSGGGQRA